MTDPLESFHAIISEAGITLPPAAYTAIHEAIAAAVKAENEACADLAKNRNSHWTMKHPDDAAPFEVCDDISACEDIAAAIRSRMATT